MAMARAQEMQEENGHGGTTHMFVMAGLHVKQPMFYPRDWDGILWYFADAQCAFSAVNVLYFGMGFGGIPYL
jgi:hypothetical protein